MNLSLKVWVPKFVIRWAIKRHPWLLSNDGTIRRAYRKDMGGAEVSASVAVSLAPETRERFQDR